MSQTLSGSRGALKINGQKIAWVGGVDVTEDDALTRIEVLDQLQSAELAETGHTVEFTANYFKVAGQTTSDLGLSPANLSDILSQPELTMEIYDSVTGNTVYTITGVKFNGGSGSMEARGVWTGQWKFMGLIGRGL